MATLFSSAARADGSSGTSSNLNLRPGGTAGLLLLALTVASTSRFTASWLADLGARGLSWPGAKAFRAKGGGVLNPSTGEIIAATAGPDPIGSIMLEHSADGGTTWLPYGGFASRQPDAGVVFTSEDMKYPEARTLVIADALPLVRAKYAFVSGPPAATCTFSLDATVT